MRRIFKYDLPDTPGILDLDLPVGSELLSVAVQNGKPVIYALVEEESGRTKLLSAGVQWTGRFTSDAPGDLLGTLVLGSGIVIHVFDITIPEG